MPIQLSANAETSIARHHQLGNYDATPADVQAAEEFLAGRWTLPRIGDVDLRVEGGLVNAYYADTTTPVPAVRSLSAAMALVYYKNGFPEGTYQGLQRVVAPVMQSGKTHVADTVVRRAAAASVGGTAAQDRTPGVSITEPDAVWLSPTPPIPGFQGGAVTQLQAEGRHGDFAGVKRVRDSGDPVVQSYRRYVLETLSFGAKLPAGFWNT